MSRGSSDDDVAEPVASLLESAETQVEVTHTQSFEVSAGPLPHPDFFQAYENTLPGAADRILAMAESSKRSDCVRMNRENRAASGLHSPWS